jgi:hypothetical protein
VVLSIGTLSFQSQISSGNQAFTKGFIDEIQDDTVICSGKVYFGENVVLELSNCLISLLDTNSLESPEDTDSMIKLLFREE